MNHGSTIQFDVRVYDIWFDRSIFIMDDNGTVSPIATVSSRRLNAGGAPSVRVALGSPYLRELRSVYIHKRPNVGGTIGKRKKKRKRKRKRRREREEEEDHAEEEEEEEEEDAEEETFAGNLHDEHRRALNIFKHQRRGRGRGRAKTQRRGRRQSRRNERNDDDDDDEMMRKRTQEELREERRRRQEEEEMVGPLAERVHRFIEERTYHENPAMHTNVLRISRVLCIMDQEDGVLYGEMENVMEEKEEKEEYASAEGGEGEGGEVDNRRDVSFVEDASNKQQQEWE